MHNLDFRPHNSCPPELPSFICKNIRVNGWENKNNTEVFFKGNLAEIIHYLYRDLSILELGRIYDLLMLFKIDNSDTELKNIFHKYGYFLNQELINDLDMMKMLPEQFCSWIQEKKIHPGDLAPLRAIKDTNAISDWLTQFLNWGLSKSEGTLVLELICDLFLVNKLPPAPEKYDIQILTLLKKLRYPQSSAIEENFLKKIKNLPWTKDIQIKTERRGDQVGTEIKFFVKNSLDFKNKIENQSRVLTEWLNSEEQDHQK